MPKGLQPTTENLVILIWKQIAPQLEGCELHCVKLYETENIFAEYYGEWYFQLILRKHKSTYTNGIFKNWKIRRGDDQWD